MQKTYIKIMAPIVIILVLLFLLSSTNLILKPEEIKIRNATFLLNDTNSPEWRNYQLGAAAAAKKYNIDLTTQSWWSQEGDSEQQLEQMEMEFEFGAEGMLISTSQFSELAKVTEERNELRHVIFGKIEPTISDIPSNIYYDYIGAAQELSSYIKKNEETKERVYVIIYKVKQKNLL